MHVNDDVRIKHIREAALEARELMRNATRQDLNSDRKLSLAIGVFSPSRYLPAVCQE